VLESSFVYQRRLKTKSNSRQKVEYDEYMPYNRHVYEKAGYIFTGKTEKINDKLTLVYYQKEII